jgi:WD40 repeat protein/serine/threonine protein kinase
MASPDMQRDLLLGHLALELNFIGADTLSAAKQVWSDQKARSLGQILVDRQAISPHTLGVLENLVQLQMAQDASEEDDKAGQAPEATMPGGVEILTPPVDEAVDGEPSTESQPETTVRFRKVRPLAAGALGQVYEARDRELRRKVALKEIKDRYADNPDARSRFLLEGEITGRLEHPGVVPVYGMGTYANGRPFYAMRFIKGESLAEAIKGLHAPSYKSGEYALELRKLLSRFIVVCDTMQYAHDNRIVHRDLKPSNIMLGKKYGETLVVDWGLAKVMGKVTVGDPTGSVFESMPASGSSETLPGKAIGTITYMSPEQAAGRLEEVGPASDVYSLGATLFSILTSRASVEDSESPDQAKVDMRKLQRKVLAGQIHRPRDLKPDIDRALEAICLKSMSLRPSDRYASARALADDLEKWLANEPVSAWPEPWTVRARRWVSRHRTLVAGAAAALLVGLASSLGFSAYVIDAYYQLEGANVGRAAAVEAMKMAQEEAKEQQKLADKAGQEAKDKQKLAEKASSQLKTQQDLLVEAKKKAADLEEAAKAATKKADEQQELAKKARLDETKARADAAMTLAVNRTILAQNRWNEGQVILANEMLENVDPQFRLGGWQFLRRQFEGSYATLYGHVAPVRFVAFSPDGRLLASAAAGPDDKKNGKQKNKGGTLKLWDAATGRSLPQHTLEGVTAVAFTPDGKRLAVAGADGTIKLWDVAKAAIVTTSGKMHDDEITCLAFSPDGKHLASASENGDIKLCDADKLENPVPFKKGHSRKITSLSFSPDGKRLASTSLDNTVLVWNADKREIALTFTRTTNGIAGAPFSPSGSQLATASLDGKHLKLWNPASEEERVVRGQHVLGITNVIFSPDGQRVASASFDGTIKIWDARRGTELQTLQGHAKPVMSISFSPDGQRLASASDDWTVKLWDLASGQELQPFAGPTSTVACLSFSPDDKQRLAAGTWNGTVHVWNGLNGKASLSIKAHPTEVLSVALNAAGTRVASGGQDGKVKVWDTATGKELPLHIKGHTGAVTSVAFSRDDAYLASAGKDKMVKVWDARSGKEIGSLQEDTKDESNEITSVSFSPNGQRLAWADRSGSVKVRNIKDTKDLFARSEHISGITSVAFAPLGDYLASAGQDGRVILWDAQGNLILSLKGHAGGVMSLSFSSDGKRLATASKDGTVKLWDARTGQAIKTFVGHADLVTSVAFSPDGKHLVSASLDKTIKLWDVSTAKASQVFKDQHFKPIEWVAFSANGKQVFSRDQSDKVVAWDVETGQMLPGVAPEPGAVSSSISRDGEKLALPVSNWFRLIDLKVSDDEQIYRKNISRLRPEWHRERALHYEGLKEKQWHAAAFHWNWVVLANPADEEAQKHLTEAYGHLGDEATNLRRQLAPALKRE